MVDLARRAGPRSGEIQQGIDRHAPFFFFVFLISRRSKRNENNGHFASLEQGVVCPYEIVTCIERDALTCYKNTEK